ncbi:MAG TPA: PQQ-dependent sugar dehydrogenase [Thermoleophilaceae bacterium]
MSARRLAAPLAAAIACAVAGPAYGQAGVSYSIPPDNPFVGRAGAAPEIYAYGLRNPYRFSFDSATGDLVIGDVGGGAREEIDWLTLQAARGANFGWPCREGRIEGPRPDKCPVPGAVEPVFDYERQPNTSVSVIAGYVVRDPAFAGLGGRLLYADYFAGEIFSLPHVANPTPQTTGVTLPNLSSFAQTPSGALYAVHQGDGKVYRLVAGPSSGTLATQAVAGSYDAPTYVAEPPGDPGRLFVVEQTGAIRTVGASTPFLNISDLVSTGGERGLLSMAFAPDYATSGRFYVYYTNTAGNIQIDEFRRSADPSVADRNSRRPVLSIPHPEEANHNGGQLQFGPDGYLYAGTGDGGGQEDQHNNAQDLSKKLGKLLRIDPAQPSPGGGGGPTPPARDVTPPLLRTRVAKRQRVLKLHGVLAHARCDERCALAMSGRVRVGRHAYKLRRATKTAAAGTRRTIKARLTRRASRAVRRALRRHRKVTAVVGLRATDAAGNRSRLARARVRARL